MRHGSTALRDWVHRSEAEGISGLHDRPRTGRPPGLSPEQEADFARIVEAGPELEKVGVVRWRRVDLQKVIAERFGVSLHERSVGRLLRKLRFRRLSPRPAHPKADDAAKRAFKDEFAAQVAEALPATAKGKPIEVWFSDEARVGQQGTLTYLRLGQSRLAPTRLAGSPVYLGLLVRCGLSGPRHRCRGDYARGQCRGDERASGRDQPMRFCRSHRCPGARPCRLAYLTASRTPGQHRAASTAALRAGTQSGREHLAIPSSKSAQPPHLGHLRADYRCLS